MQVVVRSTKAGFAASGHCPDATACRSARQQTMELFLGGMASPAMVVPASAFSSARRTRRSSQDARRSRLSRRPELPARLVKAASMRARLAARCSRQTPSCSRQTQRGHHRRLGRSRRPSMGRRRRILSR